MRALAILSALALAGCAGLSGPPEPLAARLFADRLVLQMSDGHACRIARGDAAFDGPAGWGGPVQACPGVARVEVALAAASPFSQALDGLFAALTLDGVIAPRAEVRAISEQGRSFVFVSPIPVDD